MKFNAVRAWKDEAYRISLSEEERSLLVESPVGDLELSDADLEDVHGGHDENAPAIYSIIICHSIVIVGDC